MALNDGYEPQATATLAPPPGFDLKAQVRDAIARGLTPIQDREGTSELVDAATDEVMNTITPCVVGAESSEGFPVSPPSNMTHVSGLLPREADGHLSGIESAPIPATVTTEYPKWVTPHESWVNRSETGMLSAPAFGENQHIDWSDRAAPKLLVMVNDADEEAKATAAKPSNPALSTESEVVNLPTEAEIEAEAIAAEEARLAALKAKSGKSK